MCEPLFVMPVNYTYTQVTRDISQEIHLRVQVIDIHVDAIFFAIYTSQKVRTPENYNVVYKLANYPKR